ncbi:hypothetical protein SPHINGOAX6_70962 [Sphingomonas sp. AX6]|nr:hypothetical protein SPHINGOAX6_70962 [Sphingomonas sp. AX6]
MSALMDSRLRGNDGLNADGWNKSKVTGFYRT